MGRRTILLLVAALIALAGSGMVFLYVQGAENRAKEEQEPVSVLKAVGEIEPGETLADAQAGGKIELLDVPLEQKLDGAMASIGENGSLVALTRIFPNEQITASKFGTPGEQDNLTVPPGKFSISLNLTDTGRVAGFVNPGSDVAIFVTGPLGPNGEDITRLVLERVQVIAVAQTTMTTSTTTSESGAQTTESLPRTLFTLAVDQAQAERAILAAKVGELSFGLLDEKSKVKPGRGVTVQNLFR